MQKCKLVGRQQNKSYRFTCTGIWNLVPRIRILTLFHNFVSIFGIHDLDFYFEKQLVSLQVKTWERPSTIYICFLEEKKEEEIGVTSSQDKVKPKLRKLKFVILLISRCYWGIIKFLIRPLSNFPNLDASICIDMESIRQDII